MTEIIHTQPYEIEHLHGAQFNQPPDISDLRKRVIDTLDTLEIPEIWLPHIRVVGSAAMVLHGITPPVVGDKSEIVRPRDVDVIGTGRFMKALKNADVKLAVPTIRTDRGKGRSIVIETVPTPPHGMKVDLIFNPGFAPSAVYDRRVRQAQGVLATPEGYLVASLAAMSAHHQKHIAKTSSNFVSGLTPDPHAVADLRAIQRHQNVSNNATRR